MSKYNKKIDWVAVDATAAIFMVNLFLATAVEENIISAADLKEISDKHADNMAAFMRKHGEEDVQAAIKHCAEILDIVFKKED